jgi:hypothetical protein
MNAIFTAALSTSATEYGGFISYNTAWVFVDDLWEVANDIGKIIRSGSHQVQVTKKVRSGMSGPASRRR